MKRKKGSSVGEREREGEQVGLEQRERVRRRKVVPGHVTAEVCKVIRFWSPLVKVLR